MVKSRRLKLDRSSSHPLWGQLQRILERRLADGDFADSFPTDRELTYEYGVSRHTVREAVRRLDQAGLLDRRRGRAGTRVREVEFDQPAGTLYSLFREVEAHGVEQVSEVVALEVRRDSEIARRLQLSPRSQLVYLERVRHAGGEPLALDRAWLPASIARPLLKADFGRTALYDELSELCGVRLDSGWERVEPAVPTAYERRRLGLQVGKAVFAIERLTSSSGRCVEWRQSLVRGDRYAFVLEWPSGRRQGDNTHTGLPVWH